MRLIEGKMKPSELINLDETQLSRYGVCHSRVREILLRYFNQEVVTSLIFNSFGTAFLIKGKVKAFAFVILNHPISYTYNIHEIEVKNYFKLFEKVKEKEKKVIINETKLREIKAKNTLNELQD